LANVPLKRRAFVLHSLKTPDEVELLRKVYGPSFILVAAYSKREARINTLVAKIAKSRRDTETSGYRDRAEALIQRDEQDRDNQKYGQNVQDTFAKADFFVDVDASAAMLQDRIGRIISVFFGYQFHTPSQDEYGMFHAVAAARRSADLSRQVGAAITTRDGDIIAVGCNEVPKAGGGMYWEGDDHDMRDFRRGHDSSHKTKLQILNEIYGRLTPAGEQSERGLELFSKKLDGTLVMNLLEFGRIIHAEMASLIDASRRGVSVRGATMYVTTFPCHMCARHIIAAGIKRVVYIEPYPKSRVAALYRDSVSVDGNCGNINAVQFQPFVGVAPRKYMEMFEIPRDPKRKNKDTGDVVKWEAAGSTPRFREFVACYVFIELRAEQYWANLLERKAGAIAKNKHWPIMRSEHQPIDEWLRGRIQSVKEQVRALFPEWVDRVVLPPKPAAASKSRRSKRCARSGSDTGRPVTTNAA
jgi:cytidine deaminase